MLRRQYPRIHCQYGDSRYPVPLAGAAAGLGLAFLTNMAGMTSSYSSRRQLSISVSILSLSSFLLFHLTSQQQIREICHPYGPYPLLLSGSPPPSSSFSPISKPEKSVIPPIPNPVGRRFCDHRLCTQPFTVTSQRDFPPSPLPNHSSNNSSEFPSPVTLSTPNPLPVLRPFPLFSSVY